LAGISQSERSLAQRRNQGNPYATGIEKKSSPPCRKLFTPRKVDSDDKTNFFLSGSERSNDGEEVLMSYDKLIQYDLTIRGDVIMIINVSAPSLSFPFVGSLSTFLQMFPELSLILEEAGGKRSRRLILKTNMGNRHGIIWHKKWQH